MADGYVDPATGQYIPGSFADQLDLPGPGNGPFDGAVAKAKLTAQQQKGKRTKANISAGNARLKAYQATLKNNKHLTFKQKAQLQAKIKSTQNYIHAQVAQRTVNEKLETRLENAYYQASGQFDKLLTGENRDAYAALRSLFNNYGLGSLAPKIYEYVKNGYGADTITLLLQDTKEYKERFAGNEARTKKGLPVLSPAEYLSVEQSYRQIMQDAGLPKGFYDNPADFRNWIAGDVSPTELKGRVDMAVGNTLQANSSTISALQQLYGVDKSYITAYFLDQSKALPLLQKQAQAAQFGGEALKRNLALNKQDLEDFVTAGLSLGQVSQGFQAVAESLPNIQAIAARFGDTFTQHELEKDLIEGGATAATAGSANPTAKRKMLASQERALFAGSGGASPAGLSSGYQST